MARRILLFVTDLEIGGTPTVVREIARRLRTPGQVEVEVACLKRWGPVADRIRDAGIDVTAFDIASSLHLPRAVRRLRELVRQRNLDTVFSFLIHANTVAAIASRDLPGVRFIQSIQTTQPWPKWHWWMQRCIASAAETIVVPSSAVAEAAQNLSHVPADRLLVVPNAIDPDAFARSPVPDANPRPFPIGFIGRLDPVKRLDWLLDEMAMVDHLTRGAVHLHIFGDGPEREPLREKIVRLKIDRLVTMHGSISSPQQALSQIGTLVLRSEAEGFGLVLIEAMAAGVPVVGTDVPGIRNVIRHEENGLLVPYASSAAMAMTLTRLIEDPPLRSKLIDGGLRDVRERFSWEKILPQYRKLLRID